MCLTLRHPDYLLSHHFVMNKPFRSLIEDYTCTQIDFLSVQNTGLVAGFGRLFSGNALQPSISEMKPVCR